MNSASISASELRRSGIIDRTRRAAEAYVFKKYREQILKALRVGLTKDDLRAIAGQKCFFNVPYYPNSLLIRRKLRLHFLSYGMGVLRPRKRFYAKLRRLLHEIIYSSHERWSPSLVGADLSVTSCANYKIELHVIKSPHGFDWQSPRGLFLSLKNYLDPRFSHKIGHAFVVLRKNEQVTVATGMTGETNYQVMSDWLFKKAGLEVLMQPFRGRLEDSSVVLGDIEKHRKLGYLQTLTYEVSPEQYGACLKHLSRWAEHGMYRNYGLHYSVLPTFGASCTSFAVNFLQVANLLSEEQIRAWTRTVSLPESLVRTSKKGVGFIRLFSRLARYKSWGEADSKQNRELRFLDPDLMFRWIENAKSKA